jgi:hypothetical protein
LPTTESIYRIERYDGIAVRSVQVQVDDNDRPGVLIEEPNANTAAPGDVDYVTSVIENGAGDEIVVTLNKDPGFGNTVTVRVDFNPSELPPQLSILNGVSVVNPGDTLSFDTTNWSTGYTLDVTGIGDGIKEGFHSSLISFTVETGSADNTVSGFVDDFEVITEDDDPVLFVGLTHVPVAGTVTVTVDGENVPETTPTPPVDESEPLRFWLGYNKVVFVNEDGDITEVRGDITVTYDYVEGGFSTAPTQPALVRIADSDAASVVIRQTGGTTDVIETRRGGSEADSIPEFPYDIIHGLRLAPWTDSYEVVLTKAPTHDVEITVTPEITKTTRTGGIRYDLVQVAVTSFAPGAIDNGDGTVTLVFTPANWSTPQTVEVTAIDDEFVDGGDTKVFAPGPNTLSGILGPVFIEGASGNGSLTGLTDPLMLPGEINRRPSDGSVVAFTANPAGGFGALEQMVVLQAELEAKRIALGLSSIDDLVGLTIEISSGQGLETPLDPAFPDAVFDRFWQITAISEVSGQPDQRELTLKNPSQLDVSLIAPENVPTPIDDPATEDFNEASEYAITTLSANFFVDETTQIDVMFVHDEDSPADSSGILTRNRLTGLNMGPDLQVGGILQPGGITYDELEVVDIQLGIGDNDFKVLGTHTRDDGYQTWTIVKAGGGDDDITVDVDATDVPVLSGSVVSAAGNTIDIAVTGTAPADDSLRDHQITVDDGVGGTQTRRIISNDGATVRIDGGWDPLPDGSFSYSIVNLADGAVSIDAEAGDDAVDASASTRSVVMFGGDGMDELTGGTADDIIFGDRGRVDYFDETGMIVTRLGTAPEPITGPAPLATGKASGGGATTLTDATAAFDTDVFAGLLVAITDGTGEGQSRLITANDATTITVATAWDIQPDATSRYRIVDLAAGNNPDGLTAFLTDGEAVFPLDADGLIGLEVVINNGTGFLQDPRVITANDGQTLTLDRPWDVVPDGTSTYRISTVPEDQTDGVVRDPTLMTTRFWAATAGIRSMVRPRMT